MKLKNHIDTESHLSQVSLDNKLEMMGKKMTEETNTAVKDYTDSTTIKLEAMQTSMDLQQTKISDLESQLSSKDRLTTELQIRLEHHIKRSNEKLEIVKDQVEEARYIANEVEAHGRRWSVRLHGINAPTHIETTDESKEHVLRFLAEKLDIQNVRLEDLDCAHRVGGKSTGKQIILVRFFPQGHCG